ncbi:MAG TPA: lipid-binding SYLF domain-containing protein [Terracidiphilus sp.]|nr:lipid-binding SYLF domain-containing protein [Terracidiphilus sp.]
MITHESFSWSAKRVLSVLVAVSCCAPLLARGASEADRVAKAGVVFQELVNAANGIPRNLLNKADCVIVLPSVKKGGFIIAGEYGKGVMSCRSGANFSGRWSAPIMMQSGGGSFGFQAGGEATDFVILVMNPAGAHTVMKGAAKLGADASVAAGPIGRDAEAATSEVLNAQMLSYSRAKGVFGGVSLAGTSLGPDPGDNEKLYGRKISGDEIFHGAVGAPASAGALLAELHRASPAKVR